MSDEEEEETGGMSIEEVFEQFKTDVGHYPHKTEQFLAYCKNNNHPYRFKDIREFWPTRPIKEEKPAEKAVNANDYRDGTEAASPEPKVADDAEAEDQKSDNEAPADNDGGDNDDDGDDADDADDAQPDPEPEPEAQPDPEPEPAADPEPAPAAADEDAGGDDDDEEEDDDDGDDDDDE